MGIYLDEHANTLFKTHRHSQYLPSPARRNRFPITRFESDRPTHPTGAQQPRLVSNGHRKITEDSEEKIKATWLPPNRHFAAVLSAGLTQRLGYAQPDFLFLPCSCAACCGCVTNRARHIKANRSHAAAAAAPHIHTHTPVRLCTFVRSLNSRGWSIVSHVNGKHKPGGHVRGGDMAWGHKASVVEHHLCSTEDVHFFSFGLLAEEAERR